MGKRRRRRAQTSIWVPTQDLPRSAAHPWRAADSFALREFLGLALPEAPPDHSTISRTRRLNLGENGYEAFTTNALPPAGAIRVATRFQTGHPNYRWLNRLPCFNVGEVDFQKFEVHYDVYALPVAVAAVV